MTTGTTIAMTRWTFVGKVMSLLYNILSRLVITFLPRSKHLLISWLQSLSAVILEPPKIKSDTVSTVSPSISHEEDIAPIHNSDERPNLRQLSFISIFTFYFYPHFRICHTIDLHIYCCLVAKSCPIL